MVYHTYDSRKSEPGFPDLVLVRRGRIIFAELKRRGGQLTGAQGRWLNELDHCEDNAMYHASFIPAARPVVTVHTWRPSDWLNGTIEGELKR